VELKIARYIHLVAPTAADVRDVMIEGPAGIMSIAPAHNRPVYQPSLRRLTWPSGAVALLFSADNADTLRGPQCDTAWVDELCAMRTAQQVLENADFGLRMGKNPQMLITTTPRPIKCFKALLARDGQGEVVVTRGSSYRNRENLAPSFFSQIIKKFEGTRLGKQEIDAELLTDTPGALWRSDRIEELRVNRAPEPFERVVVSIDPAVTFGPDADETGIVVTAKAQDGAAYVLEDGSGRYPPAEWALRAIQLYRQYSADRIIGEVNNGGALIESTLRSVDPTIPFRAVHASRGKLTRAEPCSALYERGLVHHVGIFGPLEDQMTNYDGSRTGGSPDRLDALCWGLTELMLTEVEGGFIKPSALLPRPTAPDAAREPIEMPQRLVGVFAVAAAAIGTDIDAIGTVYFGFDPWNYSMAPLVVLGWNVTQIEAGTLNDWFGPVNERLNELEQLTNARCNGGINLDPEGIGSVLWEQLAARRQPIGILNESDNEQLFSMTIPQRVIAASARVNAGSVMIVREAYEQLQPFNGAVRNHFRHALAAFGTEKNAQQLPGVLLTAFADGVVDAFNSPEMRRRVSQD